MARWQLLEPGFTPKEIERRLADGRLNRIFRGVYAVGRPHLTQHGRWMAAVLACGTDAALSHESAASLWEVRNCRERTIHVSTPASLTRKHPGIQVHRRRDLARHLTIRHRIPVTKPALTLVDLAASLSPPDVEVAINEADRLDLIDPESIRSALPSLPRFRGMASLRGILDHRTFVLTDSELERRFLPIARRAGLPKPLTRHRVNGFRVDFYWPDLGLVVETDGLRYHRTPAQQTKDRIRDQTHLAAGLTALRFTHAQVTFESARVAETLAAVAKRLR